VARSKKYKGKPCAYCGAPATGPDHVIGPGFFVPTDRDNCHFFRQPIVANYFATDQE